MRRLAMLGFGLALTLTFTVAACGGSGGKQAIDQATRAQADRYAIEQIEATWHKASSTHDVNLMMTLWAPDATFGVGAETLTGKAEIRSFFVHKVAPFQPENRWISETPAYKIRVTVNGDKGTLYFQCVYVDMKTGKVKSVVAADQNVQKIDGKWLITSSAASPSTLGA